MNAASDPIPRTRLAEGLAAFAVVGGSLAYSFRFVSFLDAKLLLFAVSALLLALVVLRRETVIHVPHVFVPVFAAAAVSVALHVWATSAVPAYSVEWSVQLSLVALLAVVVANTAPENGHRIEGVVVASAVAVAAVGLGQYAGLLRWWFPEFPYYPQRMYSVFGNQDLLGGYTAFGLVVLAGMHARDRQRAWWRLAGLAVLLATLGLSASRSAWLAAAIGLGLVAYRSRDRRRLAVPLALLTVITVSVVAIAPETTVQRVQRTFSEDDFGGHVRLWFWAGAVRMTADHPVLGVGAGNFQYESPRYLGQALYSSGPEGHVSNQVHTLHAHADVLELLAEFGVVGIVLGAWLARSLPWRDPVAGPGIVAYLAFGALNTTVHSPPHVLAFLLLAAAGARRRERESYRITVSSRLRWASVALVAIVGGMTIMTRVWPSALLAHARDAYERDSESVIEAYDRAVRFPWPQYQADLERGILAAQGGQADEALRYGERALEGLDTGEAHLLVARQYDRFFDRARAYEAYDAVVARWPRYVPAWRGLVRNAPDGELEEVLTRAKPWMDAAAYGRLRSLAERRKAAAPSA